MNFSFLIFLNFFSQTLAADKSPQTKEPLSITPIYPKPNPKHQEEVHTTIKHFEKLLENSERKKKLSEPGDTSNS